MQSVGSHFLSFSYRPLAGAHCEAEGEWKVQEPTPGVMEPLLQGTFSAWTLLWSGKAACGSRQEEQGGNRRRTSPDWLLSNACNSQQTAWIETRNLAGTTTAWQRFSDSKFETARVVTFSPPPLPNKKHYSYKPVKKKKIFIFSPTDQQLTCQSVKLNVKTAKFQIQVDGIKKKKKNSVLWENGC